MDFLGLDQDIFPYDFGTDSTLSFGHNLFLSSCRYYANGSGTKKLMVLTIAKPHRLVRHT